MTRRITIIPGDDAAPEAMACALRVLRAMELDLEYDVLPAGVDGVREHGERFIDVCRASVDASETTLFGAHNGTTPAINHLRWGRRTFANVRPVRYFPGMASPLRNPEGIDFVIIRENLEDLLSGVEGDLEELESHGFRSAYTGEPLPRTGRFALKVITEANSRRVIDFAFRLAQQRQERGSRGRVTLACKYNRLPYADGLFREVGAEIARQYPEIEYRDYLIDDFARRIVAEPQELDVVVLPNLYGDILSDEAAALVGGLGVAPSGCFGEDFAYFEPVHGTAPDIAGRGLINPTATLLSAAMMLDHLEMREDAARLEGAVRAVYAEGRTLTPDQGGTATSDEITSAIVGAL
jgi:isocitrate/isopropylmalate dehydrogenase